MRRVIAALIVGLLLTLGASVALAGSQGYEGQPGNQSNGGGGNQGYEGQPGNQSNGGGGH